MKIKAKFKGSNSLGYENGVNYDLYFRTEIRETTTRKPYEAKPTFNIVEFIRITPVENGLEKCEYGTLKAFLNNWQILE